MAQSTAHNVVYQPGDRLYGPMWQLLQILGTISYSHISSLEGEIPTSFNMGFASFKLGTMFTFPMGDLLSFTMNDIVPDSIEIQLDKAPAISGAHPSAGKAQQVSTIYNLAASLVFGNFYEAHTDFVRDKWQNDISRWPEVINFARVVRNAISHSGNLHFRGPASPSASWRSLSYGPADDGKKLIGDDINCAELAILMIDMADELDRCGAPVVL